MIRQDVAQTGRGAPCVVDRIDLPGRAGVLRQLAPDAPEQRLVLPVVDGLEDLFLRFLRAGELVAGATLEGVRLAVELVDNPLRGVLGKHRRGADGAGLVPYDQLSVSNEYGHGIEDVVQRLGPPLHDGLSFAPLHRSRENDRPFGADSRRMVEKPFTKILGSARHVPPLALKTVANIQSIARTFPERKPKNAAPVPVLPGFSRVDKRSGGRYAY